MTSLLLRDMPPAMHEWLKQEAARNRRSMMQQALAVFEERMRQFRPVHFSAPARTRTSLTAAFIERAKRGGRK